MKLLVCCEESQTVCKAFRDFGWEAYSCDIEPESGGASRVAHQGRRPVAHRARPAEF